MNKGVKIGPYRVRAPRRVRNEVCKEPSPVRTPPQGLNIEKNTPTSFSKKNRGGVISAQRAKREIVPNKY